MKLRCLILSILFFLVIRVLLQVAFFVAGADAASWGSIYVINPISKQKILPYTPISSFPLVGNVTDSTINVKACRGEFEPASFVIRPDTNMSNISFVVSDLQGLNGSVISKTAIDIRLVKCWYQAGLNIVKGSTSLVPEILWKTVVKGTTVYVPELLLKDDSLVKVDEVAKKNYLRVRIGGEDKYIDITAPDAVFPANAQIYDAKSLLPFDIQQNTNKQVWLSFQIPAMARSSEYKGKITLVSDTQVLETVNINLTVLPFDLEKPVVEYGIYYTGRLRSGTVDQITSEVKTANQYRKELQNMKDHGVLYPTLYQSSNWKLDETLRFIQALKIRKDVGLPTDKLYAVGIRTDKIENNSMLMNLSNDIDKWKKFVLQNGYKELYIYGKDEAAGDALLAQRSALQMAHDKGVKVFVAVSKGAVDLVGDLLDYPVLHGSFQPEEVAKWHKQGKKVSSYANPQVGVEDAEIYRRNYGIPLLCNGYDGVMNFAYQYSMGHIWNDFDHSKYRDHVFAYPTSDGVIDTVQWEGFRAAVDDVRYLTTLVKVADASAYSSICGRISTDSDLSSIRQFIVDRILNASTTTQKP